MPIESPPTVNPATLPGYELAYAEITTSVNLTATTEATADVIVTAPSVTFDGAPVLVTVSGARIVTDNVIGDWTIFILHDDTANAVLGTIALIAPTATAAQEQLPMERSYRYTPSAGARVLSWRGYSQGGTGAVGAASGGPGTGIMPAYLRITKV